MSWRFFAVMGTLFAALLVNAVLLFREDISPPVAADDMVNAVLRDPLSDTVYTPSARVQNFRAFGFDDNLAKATANEAAKITSKYQAFLKDLLAKDADELGRVLCGGELPPRYAALEILAAEDAGAIKVIDATRAYALIPQPWFTTAQAPEVFAALELRPDRKQDATVMGVAALLLRRQDAVFDEERPWAPGLLGGGWGVGALEKKYPTVMGQLVQYFALMHVIEEIANGEGGICRED